MLTDRYKLDITAIQEIRWTGEGVIEKKKHILFTAVKRETNIWNRLYYK
jgi:hypothetical protein